MLISVLSEDFGCIESESLSPESTQYLVSHQKKLNLKIGLFACIGLATLVMFCRLGVQLYQDINSGYCSVTLVLMTLLSFVSAIALFSLSISAYYLKKDNSLESFKDKNTFSKDQNKEKWKMGIYFCIAVASTAMFGRLVVQMYWDAKDGYINVGSLLMTLVSFFAAGALFYFVIARFVERFHSQKELSSVLKAEALDDIVRHLQKAKGGDDDIISNSNSVSSESLNESVPRSNNNFKKNISSILDWIIEIFEKINPSSRLEEALISDLSSKSEALFSNE